MKLLRFAIVGLSALGIAVCLNALARLAHLAPPSKLPPYPVWTAVHFVAAAGFALIAPWQLWARFRARRPRVHRLMGRVGVALGSVMAVSGVAIAYLAPERPVSERIFMTTFFLAYLALLTLGFRAALARDFAGHRIWMIRMTATALTPITQRLVFPVFAATLGVHGLDQFWQLFVSAAWIAWALNMIVAEAVLQRLAPRPALAPA